MNAYIRGRLAKYCFYNTAIACVIIFFCGTFTASQKTAYNISLKQYPVMNVVSSYNSLSVDVGGSCYELSLPGYGERKQLLRFMKLTPFASAVLFFESVGLL